MRDVASYFVKLGAFSKSLISCEWLGCIPLESTLESNFELHIGGYHNRSNTDHNCNAFQWSDFSRTVVCSDSTEIDLGMV